MTAVESYDWPGFKKERKKSFILYNLGILRISRHLSDKLLEKPFGVEEWSILPGNIYTG